MSFYTYLSLHQDAPTNAVVAHGQTVLIDAPTHIRSLQIGGHALRRDDQQAWWVWHVPRRMGMLWLFADDAPVMTIEIVAHEAYHDAATAWYRCVHAIDPRLTLPSRYWQLAGIRRTDLEEAFAGASINDILWMLMRMYDDAHMAPLEPWHGDIRRLPRLDRQGVHGDAGGWLVAADAQYPVSAALQRALFQAISVIRPLCDRDELAQCQLVSACVQQRVLVRTAAQLHRLNDWAQRILELLVSHQPGSMARPSPDLALLYERWVWVNVLACVVGDAVVPDLVRSALDTAGTARIATSAHAWCGYQPRLVPRPHDELWSRDDRMAIPDVVIARKDARERWRTLVFDAKYSLIHRQPTAQARNDVSAYAVRIGVGDGVPDWVALVHPGEQNAQYASGLRIYGTAHALWDELAHTIHAWLAD